MEGKKPQRPREKGSQRERLWEQPAKRGSVRILEVKVQGLVLPFLQTQVPHRSQDGTDRAVG